MRIEKQKWLVTVLSFLGLSSLVLLFSQETSGYVLGQAATHDAEESLTEGESCTPYAQDYHQTLEEQSAHDEAFIAGCGGMF